MNDLTRRRVRARAGNRCEYCQLHQDDSPLARLQIEHVIPKKHGGADDEENLALACVDCNLHKGANLTGIDPDTGIVTELFHPRRDVWDEHFQWDGVFITGVTPAGRTTVRVLELNKSERIDVRLA